jgi:hypothetical protein
MVLCPSHQLNLGDPAPVAEFVEQRVRWIELLSAAANPTSPALVQALALLLQSEQELPASSAVLRARVADTRAAAEIHDEIDAVLVARFNGRSIQVLCAMGGITLDDFTQSVACREIFGRGEALGDARGEAHGEAQEEAKVTLRLLARRSGPLSTEQESLSTPPPVPAADPPPLAVFSGWCVLRVVR